MQGSGLKQSFVGNLMVYTCDPWKCTKLLHTAPRKSGTACVMYQILESHILKQH